MIDNIFLKMLKCMGMMTQRKIELQQEVYRLTELLEEANIRNAELDKALNNKIEGL